MTILHGLELGALALGGAGGVLAAGRKNLDLMGVVVVAFVTGIGGGTLRDLLLNRHPIFWIQTPQALYAILVGTVLTLGYVRIWPTPHRVLLWVDAVSLAVFTILGTQITEQLGHTGIVAVLMGVITGAAGGLIRDVLTNEIPLLLRSGPLYATAASAGCIVYLIGQEAGLTRTHASVIGMVTIFVLRAAAIRYRLSLPIFYLEESGRGRLIHEDSVDEDDPKGTPRAA